MKQFVNDRRLDLSEIPAGRALEEPAADVDDTAAGALPLDSGDLSRGTLVTIAAVR